MNPKTCPICHAAIPENAPGGLCPACVLRDAEEAAPAGRGAPSVEEIAVAFPQWEVLDLIGQGGMGFVYKVRQPGLDRIVALKVLSPELGRDPAFAERFAREARTLGKLHHPNIVTVFEHGEAGGFFYLLMEYVDGVNLRQAMRAGRFTPEQALAIVPGVCDALQAAHAQGIWHRDIKPENILLDRDGRVKIADFGIARIVGDPQRDFTLTMTGNALGSAAYMAPEQHEKPHDVDHRADIYSLGVVIYEMLTGELPLGRFPIPSQRAEVSARIDEIVLRTLEKERELRQQSADEVKTEVEGAATVPVLAKKEPVKRSGRKVVLVSCLVLLVLGLLAVPLALLATYYSVSKAPPRERAGYWSMEYSDQIQFAFFHPQAKGGGGSITIPLRSTKDWFPPDGQPLPMEDGTESIVRFRVVSVDPKSGSIFVTVQSSQDGGSHWESANGILNSQSSSRTLELGEELQVKVTWLRVGEESADGGASVEPDSPEAAPPADSGAVLGAEVKADMVDDIGPTWQLVEGSQKGAEERVTMLRGPMCSTTTEGGEYHALTVHIAGHPLLIVIANSFEGLDIGTTPDRVEGQFGWRNFRVLEANRATLDQKIYDLTLGRVFFQRPDGTFRQVAGRPERILSGDELKKFVESLHPVEAPPEESVIEVLGDGSLRLDGVAMDLNQLRDKLTAVAGKVNNPPVRIRAETNVRHGRLVEVTHVCQKAGIWNISFSTGSDEELGKPNMDEAK